MDEAFIKKIPPHSEEAEQAVIGSMIMDKEAVSAAMEILGPEDFYQPRYGTMFEAISAIFNEGKPVDMLLLQEKLKQMDASPELYDLKFLSTLIDAVTTSANIRYSANIVKEKSVQRKLIKSCEDIANTCYLDKEDTDSILNDAEKQIFAISQGRQTSDYVSVKDVVIESLKNIQAASQNKGGVTGVATGFYDLDYKTAGMQPSDLVLVAARPSMGKTAFVLNIAEHVAVHSKIATVIFSLEMSSSQMMDRILAMNSSVEAQKLRTGALEPDDWSRLMESARLIGESPLIIDDTPGISINELRSKCRRYKAEFDLGMIIIDYLQLMTAGKKVESRQQEVSEISRSLKALARELNCPVIACSQLSRTVEQRPDKRPMLSDLRESGAIEQDADVVMFLYRDEYYNRDSEQKGIAEVIISKQRKGPTGTIELTSQLEYTRFKNKA